MVTFSDDMKARFGKKIYKLSLDAGMSCPNRDGTLSKDGCIFCSKGGSGDFAVKINEDDIISSRLEEAKEKVYPKIKNKDCLFMAYFQAYSNTYAPIEKLRKLYYRIIDQPDICAVSIATRPDCLSDDVIELLIELNQIKPIWVELGLQTIHDDTAKLINRCYELSAYDNAIRKLNEAGINTVVHIILGLPFETRQMMLDTVKYVVESKAGGIKLQLLHILKGTKLADMYESKSFDIMTLEEYVSLIKECVSLLPDNMVVHRLTGDGPKKDLIEPLWSADKKRVLNSIKDALA